MKSFFHEEKCASIFVNCNLELTMQIFVLKKKRLFIVFSVLFSLFSVNGCQIRCVAPNIASDRPLLLSWVVWI